MEKRYTDELNVQILLALMKHHGVRWVVASPGTTNITFVASVQADPYFTVYSSPDERSAAYMACGIAAEAGEPVALSCTGATASRNYIPGLTEAFYRKLPVLAITSTQHLGRIGNLIPQVIDRTAALNDICKISVHVPSISSADDKWACETSLNRALLELRHRGGGPVHVNLVTTYSPNFDVAELPAVRVVDRISSGDPLPSLSGKRTVVFVGAHQEWDERLTTSVDAFCAAHDAVVLCDHTSNYTGAYAILSPLIINQTKYYASCKAVDVVIHIGEVSGAYAAPSAKEVWRVSPDGEPRDTFAKLRYVFEMPEEEFFESFSAGLNRQTHHAELDRWRSEGAKIRQEMPELPFSNIWCAQHLAPMLPPGSVLHLGILNSLRSWNFFEVDPSIRCYSNTGGFGIDGGVSTIIGASLASQDKLFFGAFGDLATFYDMNSLGNRHVGNNLRILVVNNGVGAEFKNYNHRAAPLGDDADPYVAARGHYGNRSHQLLRHYAEDLRFEYLCAATKEELLRAADRFTTPEVLDRSIVLEVFTDSIDESNALEAMYTLRSNAAGAAKEVVRHVLGDKGVRAVKKLLGK